MALTVPITEDEDPVIARLSAQHEKQAAMLKGSLYNALDTNPEQFAIQQRTAKQLGYPTPVVEAMPDLIKNARMQTIEKGVSEAPRLKQRLAEDDAFAKLAHDDTDNLSAIEKAIRFTKTLGGDVKAGVTGFNEGFYGVAQAASEVGATILDPLVGTILPENPLGRMAEASRSARTTQKDIKTAIQKARGDMGSTEQAFHSGIESATQSLLTLPLAILSRNPNVLSGTMAANVGGQSFGEARDDGKSLGQAIPFATSQAYIEYATEQIPAAKLLTDLKLKSGFMETAKNFLAREIPGEQLATVMQDLNEWAVLNPEKPFSSYLAERPEAAYQTAVATVVGGSVQVGAAKAIDKVANMFRPRNYAEENARQDFEVLQNIDKLASDNKVRVRDAETFEAFVTSAIEDGPVQNVYIDAKVLLQSGVLDQLAQVSPSIKTQFSEAQVTGGTVRIPLGEYVANIAGTELNQSILEHLKTDPNSLTYAESKEHAQSYQKDFNNELSNVLQEQEIDDAFRASSAVVQSDIARQLKDVSMFTSDVNDTNAITAASHYSVRAAQLGMLPKELYDMMPLRVTGERMAGGLEQANAQIETPQFKEWFGDSKIVDTEGKPVVVYHGTDKEFSTVKMAKGAQNVFWVTSNKKAIEDGNIGAAGNGVIMPMYASLKNPAGWKEYDQLSLDEIESRGFDGVVLPNKDGTFEAIVFHPNQVKSATKNNGNFNPNDNSLLRQGATQPNTEAFKNWFKKSKVVNPDGTPRVVYHGSSQPFEVFDYSKIGTNGRFEGPGFYFTNNQNVANGYAKDGNLMETYLSIQKPLAYDAKPFNKAVLKRIIDTVAKAESKKYAQGVGDGFLSNYGDVNFEGYQSVLNDAAEGLVGDETAVDQISGIVTAGVDIEIVNRAVAQVTGYDGIVSKGFSNEGNSDNTIYVAFFPEQIKSATGNNGDFNSSDPNIFNQNNRGAYSPNENTISLLKNADLSTFLHELGHAFLTMDVSLASQLASNANLTEGEQEIVDDVAKLFNWFGIQGGVNAQLDQWYAMTLDEQRVHHEKLAEGFEAYLFEGKAPSLELQPLFQRMRAWFLNVYRNMMAYLNNAGETLSPEVRSVFDRMLASTEQIKLAQQARSMMPLFESANQAGMTADEFSAYQNLDPQATQDAIAELQTRGLRDMQWLNNARSKQLKKLQKEAASLRREVRMEVSTEILSLPVYRAWTFLTAKQSADDKLKTESRAKSDPNEVDETQDNIFTAIAKLGGINKDKAIAEWGTDPRENPQSGVFGKPVWRKQGGLSLDAMAELLAEHGYLTNDKNGKYDLHEFEERFNEQARGNKQVSLAYDYSQDQAILAGSDINVEALGSGRLDIPSLKDTYGVGDGPELVGLINLRMTSENGLHQDIVAEMFGFSSGDELVKALLDAQPPRQAIEDATDTRMLERHGDLSSPEALGRAADQAIHNDVRARMISTELNALAKATGKRATLASAAREFANGMISRLKVRDINPSQYAVAEARAAKNAATAMRKGDLETAAAEKRNQLVSNYATKSALNAKDEVNKSVAYLRKFGKEGVRKGLDVDYLDQIDALLDRFDLRTSISLKSLDHRDALVDWVNKQREQGLEPDIPRELINEAMRMSYKNMTLESFRGLVDSVKQIEHLGRLKNRLLTAKDQRTYEAIRDSIASSIVDNAKGREANTRTPTTNSGRALQGLKNFWASHIKAATWARILDGGQDGGPVWEYFIRSANGAADYETTERGKATEVLSKMLAPVFALGKMGGKGQYFQSIDRSLNREARIAIALNTGNASNFQRLLGGEGWTLQQIQPVLDSLSKQEWDAVQSIWDHFETYRPQIAAKERRVYGKEPNWVDPSPVQTAFGEYRGGYYPIKYDPNASQRAEEHVDAEGAKRQIQGAYTSATTRRSFTKTRVDEVTGRPLLYTLGGVYSGVNDVIHDLAWHEWLIDVNRLMRSSTIDSAIRNHYGPEAKRQFKSWIQDMAEGERGVDNAGEMVLGKLRQGVSIAGLGFNVMSAAIQITGFTQTAVRLGAKWTGRGISKYIASPIESTRSVTDMSEFMASRFRTQFRELNELRNQVQDQSTTKKALQDGAYFMMTRVQQMVDVPTWLGAYEKAISEGNAEERAISLADQAVIDSQMSGISKDLSAIERGGPALKLFTVFYSYMNTTFNLGVMRYMTEADKAKVAADYLLLYVASPVLGLAIKNALMPGDADDDWDFEALAKALLSESLGFMMGQMVVLREFSEGAKAALGLSQNGGGYQGPAGVRVVVDATKFTQQAHQGDFDEAFRKASINLLGSMFGLPAAQINRSINGVEALQDGKTENPAALMLGYQEPR